jgi:hypothetical protein
MLPEGQARPKAAPDGILRVKPKHPLAVTPHPLRLAIGVALGSYVYRPRGSMTVVLANGRRALLLPS